MPRNRDFTGIGDHIKSSPLTKGEQLFIYWGMSQEWRKTRVSRSLKCIPATVNPWMRW